MAESYYMRKKREREEAAAKESVPVKQETDEEIEEKLAKRFAAMDLLTTSTASGVNKALVISGPPGLGKSYGVMKAIDKAEKAGKIMPVIVKGYVRPTGLYRTLYENRFPQSVVVFDDADSIFADDISLNLLKAACDMTRERKLSWLAETKMLDEDGDRVPRKFLFEGSIIFISNYDFDAFVAKDHKLAPHMAALISRSHYLDLAMKTKRDYLIRIKQVIRQGMLKNEGLSDADAKEVIDFVEENQDKLRELSLRMVVKIANLRSVNKYNWRDLASATCMRVKH